MSFSVFGFNPEEINQEMAAEAAEVRLAPLDHPTAPEWTAVKGAEGEGKARPLTAGLSGATP